MTLIKLTDYGGNYMNLKRTFLVIGLALVTGGSCLVGLNNNLSSKPVVEAKAEATPEQTTIYVEVCESWHEFSAAIRLQVTPAESSWIKPTTIKTHTAEHNALYSFSVPAGVTSFFIDRMNPDNPDSAGGIWNSTESINYSSSYNYYNVTSLNSYSCPYTPGWMNVFHRSNDNHQDFRLTIINEDYNWFTDNAVTTIRFWDGTEIQFSKFISYYGSAIYTNTLKCDTIGGYSDPAIYATGFNIFRKSSDKTTTYSQTGNWAFTYENKDMNAFVIKAKTGDAQFYDGTGQSKVIGPEYNAMAYSIFFLETTNPICYGKEDDDNLSALSDVWGKLQGAANASTNGNNLLKTAEEIAAFETSEESYTHNAYLRYMHIVEKYPSLTNYLDLSSSPANKMSINNSNNIGLIIVSSSIAIISIVGAVLIVCKNKRKENY